MDWRNSRISLMERVRTMPSPLGVVKRSSARVADDHRRFRPLMRRPESATIDRCREKPRKTAGTRSSRRSGEEKADRSLFSIRLRSSFCEFAECANSLGNGAPGRIRTCDPRLERPMIIDQLCRRWNRSTPPNSRRARRRASAGQGPAPPTGQRETGRGTPVRRSTHLRNGRV